VEKESYLLELCRYIVLNLVRVKGGTTGSMEMEQLLRHSGISCGAGVLEHGLVP
jgi:hypothetical protein